MVGTSCDWVIRASRPVLKILGVEGFHDHEVPPSVIAIMLKRRGAA